MRLRSPAVMSENYYKTLEIAPGASSDEIQDAYRQLARKYHPDMNQGDDSAKKNFQQVQRAYEVLGDDKKREMYDQYGSSFESMGAGGAGGQRQSWSGGQGGQQFQDVDLSDLFGGGEGGGAGGFSDFFGQFTGGGRRGGRQVQNGADLSHDLTVPFGTAVLGGEARIEIRRADGRQESISVKVPAGIEAGKKIRLRGQGEQPGRGGQPGDLLVTVNVAPHPCFYRKGRNLEVDLPVTLLEAAEGAKVDVPTPKGTISLKLPAGSSSGRRLRIKGHGVPTSDGKSGDMFAIVQIVLPEKLSDDDLQLLRQVEQRHTMTPRSELRWS